MSKSTTIKTTQGAYVRQDTPGTNYGGTQRIWLNTNMRGYLFWSIPFPDNASIVSARLTLYAATGLAKDQEFLVRPADAAWSSSGVNWNNRPGGALPEVRFRLPSARGENGPVGIDIKPIMQAIANGGAWRGVQIAFDQAGDRAVWSDNAPSGALRPVIEIEWTSPPDKPAGLSPNGGQKVPTSKPVLSWVFTDNDGNSSMQGFQLQISPNPTFDPLTLSSTFSANRPTVDLATTSYAGIPSGQKVYWRVKHRDDSGQYSPWSDAASMGTEPIGALQITSPTEAQAVSDPGPVVAWSYTPPTNSPYGQSAYRIIVEQVGGAVIYDSNLLLSTDKQHTLPQNLLKATDVVYRITLRVFDSSPDRISNGGNAAAWAEVQRNITFSQDVNTSTVTNLRAVVTPDEPEVILTWSCNLQNISYFTITRRSLISNKVDTYTIQPQAVRQFGGNNFQWRDGFVQGRARYTWDVRVVAGTKSSNPVQVELAVRNTTPWLIPFNPLYREKRITFVNSDVDSALTETSDVVTPIEGNSWLVTQRYGGREGNVTAELATGVWAKKRAEQMKEDFKWFRENPHCFLTWADEAIEVYIYNASYDPLPKADGTTDYYISFDFIETGAL